MAEGKSPIQWGLTPLKRYAEFSGRSSRAEFWWFMLFMLVIVMVVWFVMIGSIGGLMTVGSDPSAGALQALGGGVIIIALLSLAILIPSLAVQVRRLHDTDRSAWWLGGYYLLYGVYMLMSFSMVATIDPSAGTEPNMGILGMTMILGLAIFIYMIVLLVFYCLPGTSGVNRFGPDPYGADVEQVFA